MNKLFLQIRPFLLVTDILFTAYWAISGLVVAGLVTVPTEYLFSDYHNEYVFAWNWSFFPLDLLFALTGFLAVYLYNKNHPNWFGMMILSMVLTFCAGFMAVSYWAIRLEFDMNWWIPNLALVFWPLYFLPRVFKVLKNLPH